MKRLLLSYIFLLCCLPSPAQTIREMKFNFQAFSGESVVYIPGEGGSFTLNFTLASVQYNEDFVENFMENWDANPPEHFVLEGVSLNSSRDTRGSLTVRAEPIDMENDFNYVLYFSTATNKILLFQGLRTEYGYNGPLDIYPDTDITIYVDYAFPGFTYSLYDDDGVVIDSQVARSRFIEFTGPYGEGKYKVDTNFPLVNMNGSDMEVYLFRTYRIVTYSIDQANVMLDPKGGTVTIVLMNLDQPWRESMSNLLAGYNNGETGFWNTSYVFEHKYSNYDYEQFDLHYPPNYGDSPLILDTRIPVRTSQGDTRLVFLQDNTLPDNNSLTNPGNWVSEKTFSDHVNYVENISVYNGLGYPCQNIHVFTDQDGVRKANISEIKYDDMLRPSMTYLPYSIDYPDTDVPLYDTGSIENQESYYNAIFPEDSGHAFTIVRYENSPQGRVTGELKPGRVYYDRQIEFTTEYSMNTAEDKIPILVIENEWPARIGYSRGLFHEPGTFYKKTITDEDGRVWQEFTDVRNRLILSRQFISETETADTYYIYDYYDRITHVLTPAMDWDPSTMADFYLTYKTGYGYRYDEFGNLIEKVISGKRDSSNGDPSDYVEKYIYNKAGELVLKKNSLLERDEWYYYVYDDLGRLTESSIINSGGKSESSLRGSYNNQAFPYNQILIDSEDARKPPFDGVSLVAPLQSIRYYGHNYVEIVGDFYADHNMPFEYLTYKEEASRDVTGLKAYEKLYILDGKYPGEGYVERCYFYDSRKNLIQIADQYPGGMMSSKSYEYNIGGNIISNMDYNVNYTNPLPIRIMYEHNYTPAGDISSSLTYVTDQYVSKQKLHETEYIYDDMRQLDEKKYIMAGISERFSRDIQGKMTGINSELFEMNLKYHDPSILPGTLPNYTGNITEWHWKHKENGNEISNNAYSFSYDNLLRLTDAIYSEKRNNIWETSDKYRERITQYDKNGNIIAFVRHSATGSRLHDLYKGEHLGNELMTDYLHVRSDNEELEFPFGFYKLDTDYNGNPVHLVEDESQQQYYYSWNVLNLISGSSSYYQSSNYKWLSDGTRIEGTDQDGNGYVYSGPFIYNKTSSGVSLESIVHNDGMIVATQGPTGYQYQMVSSLRDHLGSNRVLFTLDGAIARNDFYPFGLRHENNDLITAPDNLNRFLFNNKEELSLGFNFRNMDYGARIYSPIFMRWEQVDPLGEERYNHSPYVFSSNNPVNRVDPNGMLDEYTDYRNRKGELLTYTYDGLEDIILIEESQMDKFVEEVNKMHEEDLLHNAGANIERLHRLGKDIDNLHDPSSLHMEESLKGFWKDGYIAGYKNKALLLQIIFGLGVAIDINENGSHNLVYNSGVKAGKWDRKAGNFNIFDPRSGLKDNAPLIRLINNGK